MTDVRILEARAAALLPCADFRERHDRRIAAPPAAVWDALFDVRPTDLALTRTLMAVRMLPARMTGQARERPLTGRLVEHAPIPVLITDPGRAIVAGGVLQPWKLRGGAPPPSLDVDALRAFDEPGWVRCTMDFVLEPDGDGTHLRTETRVHATDARTRARFGLYWRLIRAGSGLIRRDMLRAVARRAEASREQQLQR